MKIFELIEKLEKINGEVSNDMYIHATQVKEKFGTLRFYLGPVPAERSDEIYGSIRDAEKESAKTCEACGAPAKVKAHRGWYSCICTACRR